MPPPKNQLQLQLDQQKFLHAIDYVRKESQGIKKLSTTELSRTNLFLIGKSHDADFDPWRIEATEIQIPNGNVHKINVILNPINRARELIGLAQQMSGNGQGLEAAFYLYSHLILEHLFKEANRRTAVAAALWILLISGYDCDALKFLETPVGDLRNPHDLAELRAAFNQLAVKYA